MINDTVRDIRSEFSKLYVKENFELDKNGTKIIEIINASFIADENSIFGKPNKNYINREIKWYESESLNINDIEEPIPAIWKQVANDEGSINSNYGWCIYSWRNFEQYKNVFTELKHRPNSRRAVMIYTRPSMWEDYNKHGINDFICTNAVQYLIRDNAVHVVVQMRSNDAVFGYKNDIAWQKHVQLNLIKELNLCGTNYSIGTIYWNAGSLHVYESHFHLIEEYINANKVG
jgi:thymidylate synthase